MTDSGRTVYGGGGISPDEKFVVPKPGPLETDLYVKYMFPTYARHFFTKHKEQLPARWDVGTVQMDAFRNWLLEQKYQFTEADFTKEYEQIRRRVQTEIYKTAFSVDESTKYELETDPEVEAATDAMPKAQSLLNSAARIRPKRHRSAPPGQPAVLNQPKSAGRFLLPLTLCSSCAIDAYLWSSN